MPQERPNETSPTLPETEIAPPTERDDAAGWQSFVECWQDRVYSLSLRVLREPDRAWDATQETFLTLWRKRSSYDRSRPIRPWLYQVAMNTIRTDLRQDRRRRRREREAAMDDQTPSPAGGDPLEREEHRQILESFVADLPEEWRTLLVLHYQHGLSQREIAKVLGLRRTTVQSRLGRAIDSLQGTLRRRGYIALIPGLEIALRTPQLEAAPPLLTQSLLAVPHSAAAATSAGMAGVAWTWGGLTLSKTGPLAIAGIAVLSLAIGLGAGRSFGGSSGDDGTQAELERLQGRLETLEDEGAALREERDQLTAALGDARDDRGALQKQLAALQASVAQGNETGQPVSASAIDPETDSINWEAIAAAFENDADLLLLMGEIMAEGRDPRSELSREDRQRFLALQKLWDNAAALARRDSNHPFLEPDVLTPLLSAVLAGPLGLDPGQRATLEQAAEDLLGEWPGAAEGTPLEAWQARNAILAGVQNTLGDLLDDPQQERWNQLSPIADFLLDGSQRQYSMGLSGTEGVPDRVRSDWHSHYRIRPEQENQFDSILRDYDQAVRSIMNRSLGEKGKIGDLPAAEGEALRNAYLAEQLRAEQAILDLLDEDQRAEHFERIPQIWAFEPGGSTSISISESDGF